MRSILSQGRGTPQSSSIDEFVHEIIHPAFLGLVTSYSQQAILHTLGMIRHVSTVNSPMRPSNFHGILMDRFNQEALKDLKLPQKSLSLGCGDVLVFQNFLGICQPKCGQKQKKKTIDQTAVN